LFLYQKKSEEHNKQVHVHAFSLSTLIARQNRASQIHQQAGSLLQAKRVQLLVGQPGASSSRDPDEAMALERTAAEAEAQIRHLIAVTEARLRAEIHQHCFCVPGPATAHPPRQSSGSPSHSYR